MPSELGDAQVVIHIARWRARETLTQLQHEAKVQRAAKWVSRKVRILLVRARAKNQFLPDSQSTLDRLEVISLYKNPGPLRAKFRNKNIDSLIRAANFYLSLPQHGPQKPSR